MLQSRQKYQGHLCKSLLIIGNKTKIYQQHKSPAKQPDLCFQLAPLGGSCTAVGRREGLVAGDIGEGPWRWRLMRKAETD